MKLQNFSGKSEVIDFGGHIVKFINGVAEVEDSVGEFILGRGYADVREFGKPIETEIPQIELELNPEIIRLKRETARLESIISSQNEEIHKLQEQVKVWKSEVEKLKGGVPTEEVSKEEPIKNASLEEKIRSMKKDDLIVYCKELGLPFDGKKEELIDILLKELNK